MTLYVLSTILCALIWLLVTVFIFTRRKKPIDVGRPFSLRRFLGAVLVVIGSVSGAVAILTREGASVQKQIAVVFLFDNSFNTLLLRYGLGVNYLFAALFVVLPKIKKRGR